MNTNEIFPKGQRAPAYFTGDAWVEMLITDVAAYDLMSYNVTFAPGSRNYWHKHSAGQLLLCTSGKGYYQEKGKPAQHLKAGDVVEIKPNVIHWHGATTNNEFTHVGITPKASINQVTWLEPVSDKEYAPNI
jgi:4-carboxymuconolactone decarboxylase